MTDGTVEAVAELKGEACRCNRPKDPGRTFCLKCFNKLPRHLQRQLYRGLDNGYMRAYKECCELLDGLANMGIDHRRD